LPFKNKGISTLSKDQRLLDHKKIEFTKSTPFERNQESTFSH